MPTRKVRVDEIILQATAWWPEILDAETLPRSSLHHSAMPKKFDWLIFCLCSILYISTPQHHRKYLMFVCFHCSSRSINVSRNKKDVKKNPWCDGLNWSLKSENNGKPIEIETEWKDRWNGKCNAEKRPENLHFKSNDGDFHCICSETEIFNLNKSQQHPSRGWWTSLMRTSTMVFNHQRDLCECNARLLCLSSLRSGWN